MRAGRPRFFLTAVSLGSSIACISKVSINAAGVSIIGKFRCLGVSYDIGRSPFSLSKILLKKIVLSFSPFGNLFLELVGVGGPKGRPYVITNYKQLGLSSEN